MRVLKSILFLFGVGCVKGQGFEVPDATVEAFTPRGLRVSIPDSDGIKLFAFHGKINEELVNREGGKFSQDILKPKEGRWTFYDPYAKLAIGDTLYYWTFVDYFDGERKLGYVKDDQSFTVTELLPKPGSKPTTPKTTTTTPLPLPDIDVRLPSHCEGSNTTVKGKPSCKGQLIFYSNFNRYAENKDRFWTVQRKFPMEPDYEFVIYEDNPQTLLVDNGRLVIQPVLTDSIYGENYVVTSDGLDLGEKCTGSKEKGECFQRPEGWKIIPPVVSSQLTTKGKFYFRYGKVEIRAKLPKGDWIYPELFLNPELEEYGPGYASGQMRVSFVAGNKGENHKLKGGIILGGSQVARKYAMETTEGTQPWTDDFHNYTLVWTPSSISVGVDGTVYGRIVPPSGGFSSWKSNLGGLASTDRWKKGSSMAPFDKDMFLVIGVGAGSHNFEDRSDGTKPWGNTKTTSQKDFYRARDRWLPTWTPDGKLQVDYVKVWALDE